MTVSPPPEPQRTSRTIHVTYSPEEWALLQASFPMSEDDWDAMIAVLQAMKRGLVSPQTTDTCSEGIPVNSPEDS